MTETTRIASKLQQDLQQLTGAPACGSAAGASSGVPHVSASAVGGVIPRADSAPPGPSAAAAGAGAAQGKQPAAVGASAPAARRPSLGACNGAVTNGVGSCSHGGGPSTSSRSASRRSANGAVPIHPAARNGTGIGSKPRAAGSNCSSRSGSASSASGGATSSRSNSVSSASAQLTQPNNVARGAASRGGGGLSRGRVSGGVGGAAPVSKARQTLAQTSGATMGGSKGAGATAAWAPSDGATPPQKEGCRLPAYGVPDAAALISKMELARASRGGRSLISNGDDSTDLDDEAGEGGDDEPGDIGEGGEGGEVGKASARGEMAEAAASDFRHEAMPVVDLGDDDALAAQAADGAISPREIPVADHEVQNGVAHTGGENGWAKSTAMEDARFAAEAAVETRLLDVREGDMRTLTDDHLTPDHLTQIG